MIWLTVLNLLKSPLARWIGAGVAVLILLGGVYASGRSNGVKSEKSAEAARLKSAVRQVAAREAVAGGITTKIAAKTEQARVEIRWRTQTLIEKVPTYVPAAADAACVIPHGFVQLHDAAAAGLPTSAGGPDEGPSGVPLSRVLGTVVENYGAAYDWRAEALAWRDWYKLQSEAWSKP